MEDLHLLLPIFLAGLASVFPAVGVWWIRRALRAVDTDDDDNVVNVKPSKLASTKDNCTAKHHPPDLLGAGGTESMETDDGVEVYHPSSVISDIEANGVLRETAFSIKGQRHEMSLPSSVDTSHEKEQHILSEKSYSDTSHRRLTKESSRRDRLKLQHHHQRHHHHPHRHHHHQQQKAQIDVRSCISDTCEICQCEQGAQIQFVSAQKLNPSMVQKLKHAPESARWWEVGESFHDLYHKAQRRAEESIHQPYIFSPPRKNNRDKHTNKNVRDCDNRRQQSDRRRSKSQST